MSIPLKPPFVTVSASALLSGGQVRQADKHHKRGTGPLEKLATGQIKPNGKHNGDPFVRDEVQR
ncbi:MAG: hypothetical protein P4N59_06375 [Negativicutes bacterium]|nr:hypothetical protein [Negativicutes bacterium]